MLADHVAAMAPAALIGVLAGLLAIGFTVRLTRNTAMLVDKVFLGFRVNYTGQPCGGHGARGAHRRAGRPAGHRLHGAPYKNTAILVYRV